MSQATIFIHLLYLTFGGLPLVQNESQFDQGLFTLFTTGMSSFILPSLYCRIDLEATLSLLPTDNPDDPDAHLCTRALSVAK